MARVPLCGSCGAEIAEPSSPDAATGGWLASDRDQGASDRDQTGSDQDQTWSDHDQTASERDQRTADDDQHAADDDFRAGGDASTYHRSVRAREQSSRDRAASSTRRDETAETRLRTAEERDRVAALRDRGGEGRDKLARLHDLQDDLAATREEVLLRGERDRTRAAADRAKAADDRAQAAMDREYAARERAEAVRSHNESIDLLNRATTDELTGAWTRGFGVHELSREIERAHRTGSTLTLAFIDVDHLKTLNDTCGHSAGDALLRSIGEAVRGNLRPYDVLVRYGGDELVCTMPNLTLAEADDRFQTIAATLASGSGGQSITFGLAEAQPSDGLQDLIGRADAEMMKQRASRRN
jgi:diguanylate cyclase (GGDEF)-like protein